MLSGRWVLRRVLKLRPARQPAECAALAGMRLRRVSVQVVDELRVIRGCEDRNAHLHALVDRKRRLDTCGATMQNGRCLRKRLLPLFQRRSPRELIPRFLVNRGKGGVGHCARFVRIVAALELPLAVSTICSHEAPCGGVFHS